jgi:8-oxo-dGTP pyrophosphatase MutT (NUDIX family)
MRTAREVAIFVRRGGDLLVVRRCAELGGYWHVVAGGVEEGETEEQAAARELAEETGLEAVVGETRAGYAYPLSEEPPHRRARYPAGTEEIVVTCFVVEAPSGWEPTLDWEHDAHRWCPPAEARALLRWPDVGVALTEAVT